MHRRYCCLHSVRCILHHSSHEGEHLADLHPAQPWRTKVQSTSGQAVHGGVAFASVWYQQEVGRREEERVNL